MNVFVNLPESDASAFPYTTRPVPPVLVLSVIQHFWTPFLVDIEQIKLFPFLVNLLKLTELIVYWFYLFFFSKISLFPNDG